MKIKKTVSSLTASSKQERTAALLHSAHCYINCLPYINYLDILLSNNELPHKKETQWEKPSIPWCVPIAWSRAEAQPVISKYKNKKKNLDTKSIVEALFHLQIIKECYYFSGED